MSTQYAIAPAGVPSLTGCIAKLGQGGIAPLKHTSSDVDAVADFPTQYLCTFSTSLVAAGNYDLYLYNSGGLLLSKSDVTFLGTNGETATERAAELNTATISKIDSIKSTTDKIDTGLVLDGVAWQFTVNMLETAIAEVPKYGDAQRHTQEAYNLTNKTVDVTVTKIE